MQLKNFKNQPDQRASLLFLVPGILLSIFYLITIPSGEAAGYFLAAMVGMISFVLGYWKRLRWLRIWQSLALGFAIGMVSFLVATIGSPIWNLGLPGLSTQPWPLIRAVVTIAMVLAVMVLSGQWMPHSRRLFWAVSGILLINSLIAAFIQARSDSGTFVIWDLSRGLGISAAILCTVWLSFRLLRRSGILALLMVIVAFGTLNAVNLTMADIAEGKSRYGQIALLLAYCVPLVICPAWLLLSHNWRAKKYGVLLSWGVMVVSMVIILPVIDQFLEPHFFSYSLQPVDIFSGVVEHVPLLIGLWLAFTLHERTNFFPTQ